MRWEMVAMVKVKILDMRGDDDGDGGHGAIT